MKIQRVSMNDLMQVYRMDNVRPAVEAWMAQTLEAWLSMVPQREAVAWYSDCTGWASAVRKSVPFTDDDAETMSWAIRAFIKRDRSLLPEGVTWLDHRHCETFADCLRYVQIECLKRAAARVASFGAYFMETE
jgi:hypothetical protein